MVDIFIMSVGNVQERSVKVSNRLDNYLQSSGSLKSTKILPLYITRQTNTPQRPGKC